MTTGIEIVSRLLIGAAVGVLGLSLGSCGGPERAGAEPETTGGPPLVRRVTESQYRASIADIFGVDAPIVGRFERALRVHGLEAVGTSEAGMSPFSVEQYDASALGVAGAVLAAERREKTVPCQPAATDAFDEACALQFVRSYGTRLFRRPLSPPEEARFVAAAREGASRLGDFYSGLEFSLAGMMVSPDFLMRVERLEPDPNRAGRQRLDAYSRAARLSYFLANSTPDEELMRAAAAGDLFTEAGLEAQADRLIASPNFEKAVRAFFTDMLEFVEFNDLSKDPIIYPAFNSVVAAEAQEQTLRTITDHLLKENGDYRDLFVTRKTQLTRALGVIYKTPVGARNGWEAAEFPENSGRAGLLTNISFLSLHSHPGRSSATLRGVAIREVFLCQHVPDPPPTVDFSVVQDPSNKDMPTARDRLTAHRTNPTCAGCHEIMDPIGLTLENFDGAGAFRAVENDAAIDASGFLDGIEYDTAAGLGAALRAHPETPRCFVDKMYRTAVGREAVDGEGAFLAWLNKAFADSGYRMPALMRTIATSRAFYAVAPEAEGRTAQGDAPEQERREPS